MSKVAITGNASGTGTLTIAAPNTNTNRTLTLPDSAGTMMLTDTGVTTAQMPAGSVIQVVQTISTTIVVNNTTSYVDAGLTTNITPTSSSSKILALLSFTFRHGASNYVNNIVQLTRTISGGSLVGIGDVRVGNSLNATVVEQTSNSLNVLDSPNTTSQIAYAVRFAVLSSSSSYDNGHFCQNGTTSTLTLMEIAA
jgi:hypothetical protein